MFPINYLCLFTFFVGMISQMSKPIKLIIHVKLNVQMNHKSLYFRKSKQTNKQENSKNALSRCK